MPASGSLGPVESEATSSNTQEPQLDVYGFRLPSEGLDQDGREASYQEQQEMTEKWSRYAKQRALPSAARLKRYCRRVWLQNTCARDKTYSLALAASRLVVVVCCLQYAQRAAAV